MHSSRIVFRSGSTLGLHTHEICSFWSLIKSNCQFETITWNVREHSNGSSSDVVAGILRGVWVASELRNHRRRCIDIDGWVRILFFLLRDVISLMPFSPHSRSCAVFHRTQDIFRFDLIIIVMTEKTTIINRPGSQPAKQPRNIAHSVVASCVHQRRNFVTMPNSLKRTSSEDPSQIVHSISWLMPCLMHSASK